MMGCFSLVLLADNCPDPERRAKIEAFIAAKEGRMAALIAKAKKLAERKRANT
jgi:hypothetical protein